jgi:protein-S-isoprenylcysteine O-methyltransferase Ste14
MIAMSWKTFQLRLISPLLMWAIVAGGVALAAVRLPNSAVFPRNPYTAELLVPAVLNWLYFFLGAARVNRRALRSAAAVKSLVTTGVYAKVRHPIYSADIFLAWGVFFFLPTLKILVSVVWLTTTLIAWMRLEEYALLRKFPEDYTLYKAKTPMMIPAYRRRGGEM